MWVCVGVVHKTPRSFSARSMLSLPLSLSHPFLLLAGWLLFGVRMAASSLLPFFCFLFWGGVCEGRPHRRKERKKLEYKGDKGREGGGTGKRSIQVKRSPPLERALRFSVGARRHTHTHAYELPSPRPSSMRKLSSEELLLLLGRLPPLPIASSAEPFLGVGGKEGRLCGLRQELSS